MRSRDTNFTAATTTNSESAPRRDTPRHLHHQRKRAPRVCSAEHQQPTTDRQPPTASSASESRPRANFVQLVVGASLNKLSARGCQRETKANTSDVGGRDLSYISELAIKTRVAMNNRKLAALVHLALVLALASMAHASSSDSSSSGGGSSNASSNSAGGHKASSSTATQVRQSPMSTLGAIGSLVPSLITNAAPLIMLLGIGAMMMPSLGASAMNLLRESRRSGHDQPALANMQLPGGSPFAQYAPRPLQTSPQDIYYFTKRSLPTLMSSFNSEPIKAGLQELLERVVRAIDNADKRYN